MNVKVNCYHFCKGRCKKLKVALGLFRKPCDLSVAESCVFREKMVPPTARSKPLRSRGPNPIAAIETVENEGFHRFKQNLSLKLVELQMEGYTVESVSTFVLPSKNSSLPQCFAIILTKK